MTGTNGKRNGGNWFDVEIVYESFEGDASRAGPKTDGVSHL